MIRENAIFAAKSLSGNILRVSCCYQIGYGNSGLGEGEGPLLFFWLLKRRGKVSISRNLIIATFPIASEERDTLIHAVKGEQLCKR